MRYHFFLLHRQMKISLRQFGEFVLKYREQFARGNCSKIVQQHHSHSEAKSKAKAKAKAKAKQQRITFNAKPTNSPEVSILLPLSEVSKLIMGLSGPSPPELKAFTAAL